MQHHSWRHTTWLMLTFALGAGLVMSLSACAPTGAGVASQNTTTGTSLHSTPTAAGTKGVVNGVVLASPTCPVEKVPPDPRCSPRPVPNQEVVFITLEGVAVARVTTDQHGKFTVTLPPGTYDLQVPGAKPYPTQQRPQQVTVVAGQTVQIQIMLDTGIR